MPYFRLCIHNNARFIHYFDCAIKLDGIFFCLIWKHFGAEKMSETFESLGIVPWIVRQTAKLGNELFESNCWSFEFTQEKNK